jgi:putative transcriptional regulator
MKNLVKSTRENLKINQNELAQICDVSRQSIHAVESNTFRPSVVLAIKIAQALNKKVEEIFFLERGD